MENPMKSLLAILIIITLIVVISAIANTPIIKSNPQAQGVLFDLFPILSLIAFVVSPSGLIAITFIVGCSGGILIPMLDNRRPK